MSGTVHVDYSWLYQLEGELKSISSQFSEVDDKGDFSIEVFGNARVVDALGRFTDHWSDGSRQDQR
jgi:hypothetical protein